MTMDNGSAAAMPAIPANALPRHEVPKTLEAATLLTTGLRLGDKDVVSLVLTAPGKAFSIWLMADDAISWGEKLVQAGKNAKSGLITP